MNYKIFLTKQPIHNNNYYNLDFVCQNDVFWCIRSGSFSVEISEARSTSVVSYGRTYDTINVCDMFCE